MSKPKLTPLEKARKAKWDAETRRICSESGEGTVERHRAQEEAYRRNMALGLPCFTTMSPTRQHALVPTSGPEPRPRGDSRRTSKRRAKP